MWLGELNPRVTGASSITNVTAVAYGDMPLFLFHLLEFMDVDYEIDVDELNDRWAQAHNLDEWTPVHPEADRGRDRAHHEAPPSGIWRMDGDGGDRVRAPRHRLAHRGRRARGVLPADRERRSVPLPGRRPRHPGHARPLHGRRPRAARPRSVVDHGHQGPVRERPARERAARWWKPEPFGFKML